MWTGDVGEQMSLKRVPVQGFEGRVNLTCWSPTGNTFAFLTGDGMYGRNQALWIYSLAEGKQTKLAAGK